MAVLSAANLNTIIDYAVQGYQKLLGTAGTAMGMGESGGAYGAAKSIQDAIDALAAVDDLDPSIDIGPGLVAMKTDLQSATWYGQNPLRKLVSRLDLHARTFGSTNYSTLDGWLTYLNTGTGTKWQALQSPYLYLIYNYAKGGSNYPAVNNLWFEVLQGATYTNALAKWVVTGAGTGTFTDGTAVDSAKYCGGFGQIRMSGITGTGDVTVTGTAYDPATKAVSTGKTWITNVTADGVTAMTIGAGTAPTDSLLIGVDAAGIACAAGITAGTLYVECVRPTGRTIPT